MTDQYTFRDPSSMYGDFDPKKVSQPGAGLDSEMQDKADLGADTYRGSGRLEGRKALITGGDSGIGAATAIAYAREGADVAISYLPEEESDARCRRDSDHRGRPQGRQDPRRCHRRGVLPVRSRDRGP